MQLINVLHASSSSKLGPNNAKLAFKTNFSLLITQYQSINATLHQFMRGPSPPTTTEAILFELRDEELHAQGRTAHT